MNIGIDIDDTIANTFEVIEKFAKEYIECILKRKFEIKDVSNIEHKWIRKLYGWNNEEDKNFWDMYYEKICKEAKPKKNVAKTIEKLSKDNKIIIITSRTKDENIIHITKEWLQDNKIKYDKLIMGIWNKKNNVIQNNVDLYIDDSIANCLEVSSVGIKTFMMDAYINRNFKGKYIEKVYSWDEILNKIENGF